jgi:fermentation-respiration switch protein FrsA (DUF1100 family)
MRLVLALCLAGMLAYAALCLFYYVAQERFIFIRFWLSDRYRFKFAEPFDERFLDRPDGARLHALHFPVDGAKGTVLYFHGNTGTLRRWGRQAPRFLQKGYNVLMPDPRGYGKSRGPLSEAALHADAQAWYEHLCATEPQHRIVVYGRSLGSGLATPVAARNRPRMLLLETPFANLYDVANSYLRILPYWLLLRYTFRNDRAIQRVQCPTYLFHGRRDVVVPYSSALKLYAHVPGAVPRELFTFSRGRHSNLARFARFDRILERLLNGGSSVVSSGGLPSRIIPPT